MGVEMEAVEETLAVAVEATLAVAVEETLAVAVEATPVTLFPHQTQGEALQTHRPIGEAITGL
jgi:hypothetical protein